VGEKGEQLGIMTVAQAREAARKANLDLLREIRLRPKIGVHDFNAKARTGRKLLGEGDKLKVTIMFRGREVTHPELGWKLLQRMTKELEDVGTLERQPLMEGRRMNIIISPNAQKGKPKAADKEPAKEPTKEPQYAETQNP
jgi:translation initiation factor IF-3